MTPLSAHFSLEELTASQTAARQCIDNTPNPAVVANLKVAAAGMEQVRVILGNRVITVSSGYRSPRLNAAVGGAKKSAHMLGYAIDFNCFSFGAPLAVCRAIVASDLLFDQIIEEGPWTHISFAPAMRRLVMTKAPDGEGYIQGLRA
jgi:hypothetical protein